MHNSAHPCVAPFRTRREAFARELEGIDAGDAEALHRARVATRRLRELLPLLELDGADARKLTRRLRKVTKQLGTVRELDVLMLLIQELGEKSRHSATALKVMAESTAEACVAARKRLSAKLPMAKLGRLARELERVSHNLEASDANSVRRGGPGARRAWLWALEARLARRAAQVRTAIEAAGAVYVMEPLHGVRIALKKLRYAAELAAADAPHKRLAADVEALKAAQDLLGRLHDLDVLLLRAREAQASLSPPDLMVWRDLGSLVHALEDDCRYLHGCYMRHRADLLAMANRLGAATPRGATADQRTAS